MCRLPRPGRARGDGRRVARCARGAAEHTQRALLVDVDAVLGAHAAGPWNVRRRRRQEGCCAFFRRRQRRRRRGGIDDLDYVRFAPRSAALSPWTRLLFSLYVPCTTAVFVTALNRRSRHTYDPPLPSRDTRCAGAPQQVPPHRAGAPRRHRENGVGQVGPRDAPAAPRPPHTGPHLARVPLQGSKFRNDATPVSQGERPE